MFDPLSKLPHFYQREGATGSGFTVERNGKTVEATDAVMKRRSGAPSPNQPRRRRTNNHQNQQPSKPFVWTADPKKIIAAVRREYRVLDSTH
jgi:hypothetical protein